ncbi:hypothetical protein F2P81_002858 [Scophthalmus maximus]|uniref:CREG-like beta-barrel domain-containing protein n=1 Tax=Scophthalmus maximus TaxID=52904 RepID=A0A6A4TNC8_SCOMX|nr:hypothetical protein F2P81_002858 [Scophthalmus maximus]
MSAVPRPVSAVLLGLLWFSVSGSCSFRVRIPPHEQVARVARFIAHQCDWASVATVSSRPPVVGQPFSNTLSVSDGPRGSGSGSPYLYLTRMEASVQDLQVNPAASLSMTLAQTDYCRQQGFDPQSPLCARLILSGSVLQRLHGYVHRSIETSIHRSVSCIDQKPEMKNEERSRFSLAAMLEPQSLFFIMNQKQNNLITTYN